VLTAAIALAVGSSATAQGTPAEGLSGQFGVSYALPLTGNGGAPLSGPIVRADLAYRSGDRVVTLRAQPIGRDRLDLGLGLRERNDLLSVTIGRAPADDDVPGARGARTDLQVLAVRRADAGPTLQVLLSDQRIAGPQGSATTITRLSISDRLRDPGLDLSSFDWRASVQLQQSQVAAAGLNRTAGAASFGVGAAFGGPNRRSWRPTLAFERTADLGPATTERLRLDLGLTGELTPSETLTARWRWDRETPGDGAAARLAGTQRLGVRSTRFTPVRLNIEADRRISLAGDVQWGWTAGAEAPFAERWTFGVTYRGAAGPRATEHGARARLAVQTSSTVATLRASLEAGGAWRDDLGWRPDGSLSLSAERRGDGPFTGNLTGSIRFGESLTGTVSAEGAAELGWGDASASAELRLGDPITLAGGARLAVNLFEPIALQIGLDGQHAFGGGGSSLSADLGLRYRFGGER